MHDLGTLHFALFFVATFAASLIAGLAGFAFGLIAAAVWLHLMPPLHAATLIVFYGLLVQGIAVWQLRSALSWARLWPFLAGAALGVPLGVIVLAAADPKLMRALIGGFLVLYGVYAFLRPEPKVGDAWGAPADAAVGFLNGVLGGLTGLAGILVVIWCGLRGWSKEIQRAVFQPVGVAIFAMTAVWLGAKGAITPDIAKLALLGLPALLLGTWAGLRLFGKLDDKIFRNVVLALLVVSGVVLAATSVRA